MPSVQGSVSELFASDLTRLEQFLRDAQQVRELVHPLALDVVRPLVERLDGAEGARARRIVVRWASESDPLLRQAASLV